MQWSSFSRLAVLVVVCSGLFGLFVLDGARWDPVHSSSVEPVWGAADPDDITVGPIEVSAVEPGFLRADPADHAPRDTWYAWGVSGLAVAWIAGRLSTGWRFDRRTLAFEPRRAGGPRLGGSERVRSSEDRRRRRR